MRTRQTLVRSTFIAAAAVLCVGAAASAQQKAAPAASAGKAQAAAKASDEAAPCPKITADVVAQGKKLFTGGGNCFTCHGADAKGTPLAPNLTDKTWLQIDGSYAAIIKLIHTGVPQPKEHPAPMPPMGGAQLTDAQVCAVGAYVYSLSHPIK